MSLDLTNVSVEDLVKALVANPQGAALIKNEQARAAASQVITPDTRFMLNKKQGYVVPASQHNWNNPELEPMKDSSIHLLPMTSAEGLLYLNGGERAVLESRARSGRAAPAVTAPAPSAQQDAVQDAGMAPDDRANDGEELNLRTATKEQLIAFAKEAFSVDLDPNMAIAKMRDRVRELYQAASAQG